MDFIKSLLFGLGKQKPIDCKIDTFPYNNNTYCTDCYKSLTSCREKFVIYENRTANHDKRSGMQFNTMIFDCVFRLCEKQECYNKHLTFHKEFEEIPIEINEQRQSIIMNNIEHQVNSDVIKEIYDLYNRSSMEQ